MHFWGEMTHSKEVHFIVFGWQFWPSKIKKNPPDTHLGCSYSWGWDSGAKMESWHSITTWISSAKRHSIKVLAVENNQKSTWPFESEATGREKGQLRPKKSSSLRVLNFFPYENGHRVEAGYSLQKYNLSPQKNPQPFAKLQRFVCSQRNGARFQTGRPTLR